MRKIAPSLLLLLGACTAPKLAPKVQKDIGSAGGTVAIDSSASIAIPTGALPTTTTISATATPDVTSPASTVQVGPVYTFGPEGTRFAMPVTVTLPFDSSLLPSGATSDDVQVLTAPAGSTDFQVLPTKPSADGKHIEAQTAHFSIFTVTVIVSNGEVVHFKATDPNGSAPPTGVVLDPKQMAPVSTTGPVDAGMPTSEPPQDAAVPAACKVQFSPGATSCSAEVTCTSGPSNGFTCDGTHCTCKNGMTFDQGSTCTSGDLSVASKVCGFPSSTMPPPPPPPPSDMGVRQCINTFDFGVDGCGAQQKCDDGSIHSFHCTAGTCTCGDKTSFPDDGVCGGGDPMAQAALKCGFAPGGTAPPPPDASVPPPPPPAKDASVPPPPADAGVVDGCSNVYSFAPDGSCSATQKCPDNTSNAMKCDGTNCTCANQTVSPQGKACDGADGMRAAMTACGFEASGNPPAPPSTQPPPPPPPADAGVTDGCTNVYSFSANGVCSAIQTCPDKSSNSMKCDGTSCTCANQTVSPEGASCDGADGMRAAMTACGFEASGNPPAPPSTQPPPPPPTNPCGAPQLSKSDTGCHEAMTCGTDVYDMSCDAQSCVCAIDGKPVASFPVAPLGCDLADGTAAGWSNGCKFPAPPPPAP